jgi:NAD-dependent deacetylase
MMEPAIEKCSEASIFLVIGTSLQVYPAAGLVHYAPQQSYKFLVDPRIPELPTINNLECIAATATVGVPPLVERIL